MIKLDNWTLRAHAIELLKTCAQLDVAIFMLKSPADIWEALAALEVTRQLAEKGAGIAAHLAPQVQELGDVASWPDIEWFRMDQVDAVMSRITARAEQLRASHAKRGPHV